tara:strand:- start:3637 stop:4398 length:762 start_codon:yes stop_codon:yes gene_type:complete
MQRILDIDLDVFVTPIGTIHADNRLSDDNYSVFSRDQVRTFLEGQCGLRRDSPTPGKIFEEHDEVFDHVKHLIDNGQLKTPFELVHVDAHADMGAGQWLPYEYLFTDLMRRPVSERQSPTRGDAGLNRGTFVLFLAACEWLGAIHYVHHPDEDMDFSEVLLSFDLEADQLLFQIPSCTSEQFARWRPPFTAAARPADWQLGTLIPLNLTPRDQFSATDYDFAFLTRSPGFTPPAADPLFELISEYVLCSEGAE